MKKQSPIGRILELGERERGKLIVSVILAVVGVICGMVPYYAAAQIMVRLLAGQNAFAAYVPWLMATLIGFLLRTVLYNGALGISHTATFAIPKTIRQKIIEKLPCLPLGTVADMQSGTLKDIIVDRVDSMKTTLAHLFPEMTANLAAPLLTVVYLFVLDEATANVDPENENRLQKAIEALTRDKTIIMIAHRLKTVRHADKILVIDHGRIVQQGKHEQRIRENGIYADFVGGKKESVGWKL